MPNKVVHVVIAGGGLGGLAAAIVLRRLGAEVRLYEQAAEFGEVGAGLQLGPNATRILADWGLLPTVVERGYLPRSLVLRDAVSGEELTRQPLGAQFQDRYGAPYVVIHRSDLHAILLDAARVAGVKLTTGAKVVATDGGRVTFADGTTDAGGLLLAADGLNSAVRDRIVGDAPVASGYAAYRGTLPAGGEDLSDVVAWLGPGCHFVQYPLRRGELLNQVAVFRSPAFHRGEAQWGGPDELDQAYAGCCAEVRAATEHLWKDRHWPMYDREPTERWADGRTVLVGDAAHPMLQYLAQGACQAMEDAAALGRQLAAVSDPDAAIAGYVAERAPRTARVQRTARIWGDIWHVDGVARTLRNELMQRRDPADWRYLDWLYGKGVSA